MLLKLKYGIVALVLGVLLCGCSIYSKEGDIPVAENTSKVKLGVSVALTDGAAFLGMQSRGSLAEAVNAGEKMQTLRIIIVRPDGTVEHNRYYDFHQVPTTYFATAQFEVVGGETKDVYLFANENTKFDSGRKVADYDFAAIKVGEQFPTNDITGKDIETDETSLIEVNDALTQMALPLFMSECHSVDVPEKEDKNVELIIVRAAVKFTFRIINTSNEPLALNQLTISKLARREYLLPNGVEYGFEPSEEDGTTITYIKSYKVPMIGNNEHYNFKATFADKTVPAKSATGNGEVELDPIYLLESNYNDDSSTEGRNYKISLTVGDETYENGYFNNLTALPRNTHVVVDVTLNDELTDLNCVVRVYPYGEYWLYPEFGQ
ncbi:MAG: hypothetical protein IJ377_00425 [Rikenellaceae bacterium]|nr:hypothetical protein [Rikenellaceae bacterium]